MLLVVNNLPAKRGDVRDGVQSLGQKVPGTGYGNPLQTAAWRIPWTEEPGGLQSIGLKRVGHN